MPNLAALASYTTAATALSNLVLVSPQSTVGYQPQNPDNSDGTPSTAPLLPSFVFNYEGEQTAMVESDITDHYVEDNTAVQDHIALKPEVITTHGFIGELTDIAPSFLKPLQTAAAKLTTISGYEPQLTTTALLAYNEAFFLYQIGQNTANAAVSAWSSINNLVSGSNGQSVIGSNGLSTANSQNKQQTAFQQLYGFWRERRLFTVQTPWAVFQNMAIMKLRAIQSEDDRMITDFEVTFKMIRKASTIPNSGNLISGLPTSFQGRASSQAAGVTNLGTTSPVPSTSLSDGLVQMGVA
jgi:hypothetical protein